MEGASSEPALGQTIGAQRAGAKPAAQVPLPQGINSPQTHTNSKAVL